MKVAHLTTVDLSLRFLVFPQLKAVVEAGGEALGISSPGPWVGELEEAGIRHVPLRSSTRGFDLLADLRSSVELWRVLRREKPDVLHTHNPKPGVYGRILGRLAGVPLVVNTVHGLYATEDDRAWKRLVVYTLEAVASRFSDAELVQSREDLDLLLRLRITPRSRTQYLGNGVDLARFDPDLIDGDRRAEIRHELGLATETVVVGMVGRLVAEKGYPELFEAATMLGPEYAVVCVGPDDRDKGDALSRNTIEKARHAGVMFLGMRTDMVDLYAVMDLFVLPSHREGFPRAAMEAAAMGLAVIATDIRGCRDVVSPGDNGVLVPVSDPAALAAAIKELGENENLRAAMGARGRDRARRHFDEIDVVARVLATYRTVARRCGVPWTLDVDSPVPPSIRPALATDAEAIAAMHARSIDTGFLPRLGPRFLTLLYRALMAWPHSVVLVADDGSGPGGFVAGVEDVGSFYRWFLRRYGTKAAVAALPRLLSPSILSRAWETLRYESADGDVRPELLAMAVVPELRRQGLGLELGRRFLDSLSAASVRVVLGDSNEVAARAYRKMGFSDVGVIEVHKGERSKVMVWSRSA